MTHVVKSAKATTTSAPTVTDQVADTKWYDSAEKTQEVSEFTAGATYYYIAEIGNKDVAIYKAA